MKKISPFIFVLFFMTLSTNLLSQSLEGAWEFKSADKHVVLLSKDGYFTYTQYEGNKFLLSWGGVPKINEKQITILLEFNTRDSTSVGKEMVSNYLITGDQLQMDENGLIRKFMKIDDGIAPLAGVWKISQREQNGKMDTIHQTGARKTLKILTGSRFQWFAINPETKQFSGTGGGTYTFIDGKYTENIQFFSRDNKRVGAQLVFDGKIVDGEWHHSGLSSKGEKIYEVWGRVK
jgi:hypothetical protein